MNINVLLGLVRQTVNVMYMCYFSSGAHECLITVRAIRADSCGQVKWQAAIEQCPAPLENACCGWLHVLFLLFVQSSKGPEDLNVKAKLLIGHLRRRLGIEHAVLLFSNLADMDSDVQTPRIAPGIIMPSPLCS